MISAAFFGHRDMDYSAYFQRIDDAILGLIENCGVRVFYNGYRGNFDVACARAVQKLKRDFPDVRQILALSYHPVAGEQVPPYFDETEYLLERERPPKFAIYYTNLEIVKRCGYIVSGVKYDFGGAWEMCEAARRQGKRIISIFDA